MWPETASEWTRFFVGALIIGLAALVAELRVSQEAIDLIIAFATPFLAYMMTMLAINRPEVAKTERVKALALFRREQREEENAALREAMQHAQQNKDIIG